MNIFRSLCPVLKDVFGSFGPKGQISDVNPIILPYRGVHTTDASAFYCPYIPIQSITVSPSSISASLDQFNTRYGITPESQDDENS